MGNIIRPTVEWMREKYDEMDSLLFDGELGACDFGVFTTGRGASGNALGWFKITASGIKCLRSDRRMYVSFSFGGKEYITKNNFVNFCKPRIELNGNYTGDEEAFLATLVHEMCHYYTYMNGLCPRQGHGAEFKRIGSRVSAKSGGRFTIQRLASAEDMAHLKLDDAVAAKNDERLTKKKSKLSFMLIRTKTGELRLCNFSNEKLKSSIITTHVMRNDADYIGWSNDEDCVNFLWNKHYSSAMRTYRYWNITGKPWLKELSKFDWEAAPCSSVSLEEVLGVEVDNTSTEDNGGANNNSSRYKIFRDGDGWNVFDQESKHNVFAKPVAAAQYDKDKDAIIFRQGKFTYIGTPGNWKKYDIQESVMRKKRSLRRIIKESIKKYINEEFVDGEDVVSISPDMNLSLESPMEME